jgi:hypothetical protein
MDKPTFEQVEKLFHDALALPAAERAAFLDGRCAGNAEVRAAVEHLLDFASADDEADDFLESPLAATAAMLRPLETVTVPPQGTAGSDRDRPAIPGYEFLGELGRGGMGKVWKVWQASLNRIVALKTLPVHTAPTAEVLARFRTEAEALARLQHPNIVSIYDIGEYDGCPYFTMECVDGPSLAQVLRDHPLNPAAASELLEVLARTMAAVHRQGIIHRDLKPANILLKKAERRHTRSEEGQSVTVSDAGFRTADLVPKISDFGLAKDQATSSKLTQTGVIMGTPSYMAPEQARPVAGGIGPAADIWALGAILYRSLTGRAPFEGDTAMETLAQVVNEEPIAPSRLRRGLPRDLVTICLKCLEKVPRNRYASALELAEDLRCFRAGEPIHARPVGPLGRAVRWCRRKPLVASLLALSTLLAIGLVGTVAVYDVLLTEALAKSEAIAEARRQEIVDLDVTIGIIGLDEGDSFAAVLRFTEALRLEEGFPEHQQEHRARIADALRQCPRPLEIRTYSGTVLCTQAHPGGGWVALVSPEHQLRVLDVLTGRPAGPSLPLGEVRLRGAALSPDGRMLFTERVDGSIQPWERTATALRPLPTLSATGMAFTALSEDTRWLLTVGLGGEVRLWDTASGKEVAGGPSLEKGVSLAAISDAGRQITLLGSDKVLRIWDVKEARWRGRPIQPGPGVRQVLFSPNGKRVATVGGDHAVQVWDVATGDRVAASRAQGDMIVQGCFSPDGGRVVAASSAGAVQVWEAATGRALTPAMRHGGARVAAAFCTEGNRLVVIGASGIESVWELPPATHEDVDVKSVPELVALAQVIACGRINEQHKRETFDGDALQAAWDRLHPHQ